MAERFCQGAYRSNNGKHPAVIWVIHVDPVGKKKHTKLCQHANLVARSKFPGKRHLQNMYCLAHILCYTGEEEYLFVPYSVFTVRLVKLSPDPTYLTPHVIHVEAALDNVLESETLRLAPWS